MADPKFFDRAGPVTLGQLAEMTGAKLSEGSDPDYEIHDVAALDTAGENDISFFDNKKYRDQFRNTRAGACLVSPEMAGEAPEGVHLLITPFPYKAYAHTAQFFYPEKWPDAFISPAASIDDSAQVGKECVIDPGAVIGEGAKIGDHCWIEANAVIGRNVEIGDHSRIGANATLSHCSIGSYVRLYPGVRIGQDGFGFAIDQAGHVKVPQLGRVIVEDKCEVGANTCIDRGAGPDTIIGSGTWIDNLVQIGHNVKTGKGCVLVSQVGISGSTVLGDFVAMGGQAGVAGHLNIGTAARIAAKAGVMRDVPPGEEQMGAPAMPIKKFMRQVALLNRMIKKEQ